MRYLTQARLKELLNYNHVTGIFTWIKSSGAVKKGNLAGTIQVKGYIRIRVDTINYLAHRLAFLYMTGAFPDEQTDHINHVRGDNRWANLRSASGTDNQRNGSLRANNTSGFNGVSWHGQTRGWFAQATINSKNINLGHYKTHYAACYARHYANIKYGFHKNHGLNGGSI